MVKDYADTFQYNKIYESGICGAAAEGYFTNTEEY